MRETMPGKNRRWIALRTCRRPVPGSPAAGSSDSVKSNECDWPGASATSPARAGLEVIDRQTRRTAVSSKPKEIVVVGSKPAPDAGSAVQDSVWIDLGSPVGIAAEQTLRITVFNPLHHRKR
jgi:hypothetical protein